MSKHVTSIKKCKWCGKEFMPNIDHRFYCCAECQREASNDKGRLHQELHKTCPICGKEFITHNKRYKYCSDECRKKLDAQTSLAYGRAHKEQAIARWHAYKKKYPEKVKAYQKKYREEHKEQIAEYKRNYAQVNKEKINKYKCQWISDKHKNDLNFRLKVLLRASIKRCVNGQKKATHTMDLCGYSVEQLKEHLESQFYNGMSWENTSQWEIHHIIPLNEFQFINEDNSINYELVTEANQLSNLMPLWKKDHDILTALYNSQKIFLTREEIYGRLGIEEELFNNEEDNGEEDYTADNED